MRYYRFKYGGMYNVLEVCHYKCSMYLNKFEGRGYYEILSCSKRNTLNGGYPKRAFLTRTWFFRDSYLQMVT